MKKLALMAVKIGGCLTCLQVCRWWPPLCLFSGHLNPSSAADFFCASGNVTCLIAAINRRQWNAGSAHH